MSRLASDLAALATMSPAQLRAEWRRVCRSVVPDLTPDLLMRAIAYRLHEAEFSSVATAHACELRTVWSNLRRGRSDISLRSGTRLVRRWRDKTYHVQVTDDGFRFEDRSYTSLTLIAREITGTKWSGPRFFGLTSRADKETADA